MIEDHMMDGIATIWYVKACYGLYHSDKINVMVHNFF